MYSLTDINNKQDIHHYMGTGGAYSALETYRERDRVKLELAKQRGIQLLLIPCWWDGTISRYPIIYLLHYIYLSNTFVCLALALLRQSERLSRT